MSCMACILPKNNICPVTENVKLFTLQHITISTHQCFLSPWWFRFVNYIFIFHTHQLVLQWWENKRFQNKVMLSLMVFFAPFSVTQQCSKRWLVLQQYLWATVVDSRHKLEKWHTKKNFCFTDVTKTCMHSIWDNVRERSTLGPQTKESDSTGTLLSYKLLGTC